MRANQHASPHAAMLRLLNAARTDLRAMSRCTEPEARAHFLESARAMLAMWRTRYNLTPASTRRRWRCGR